MQKVKIPHFHPFLQTENYLNLRAKVSDLSKVYPSSLPVSAQIGSNPHTTLKGQAV